MASDSDRATLVDGVTSLQAPGALPGPMVATGGSSFVILTAGGAPLFVGASAGSGRIIVGGHESFWVLTTCDPPETPGSSAIRLPGWRDGRLKV